MTAKRQQITIQGVVQGVGFRPHVYRIATNLKLTGWVKNSSHGVVIEIQGALTEQFLPKLKATLPHLARIDSIDCFAIPIISETSFIILASDHSFNHRTIISPDMGVCSDCLQELFDSESRYYLYPFLNCTQCGPRLTVTRTLPYDRKHTSMADFSLCSACEHDYHDPSNRRYHAQPTACNQCGPQLSTGINAMVNAIQEGKILAVKAMGGYQLICDAYNETSIATLRIRKRREKKPFAIMAANLNSAKQIASVSDAAQRLLTSQSRPIVLLDSIKNQLPENLAPGLNQLGVMLPAVPLHYILFYALAGSLNQRQWLDEVQTTVLVVTSANISGNPLLIDDEKAKDELSSVADLIVSYNRNIVTRVDDSVIKLINNAPSFLRRARGYALDAIKLPHAIPSTLALGAHLKNTFCITRGDEAFVSQYIGSLNNKETIDFFHESLNHLQNFLNVTIEQVACDCHPDFYTTRLAETYHCPVIRVQHHHAHLASVVAERHSPTPALGLALDGYGYGADGKAWGGELLLLQRASFERLGHFHPIPMPGGEVVVREPWRMGAAVLHELGLSEDIATRFQGMRHAKALRHLLASNASLSYTSSCGRYFDAASALLGVNYHSSYEGHTALSLESLVTNPEVLLKGWRLNDHHFNPLPMFVELLSMDAQTGANVFHGTLIAGLCEWLVFWSKITGLKDVLLSGGCFLNQILTEGLTNALIKHGLTPHLPSRVPANDGGICLGQAWVAGLAAL